MNALPPLWLDQHRDPSHSPPRARLTIMLLLHLPSQNKY